MAAFNYFALLTVLLFGVVMVTVTADLTREERDTVKILKGEPILLHDSFDFDNSTTPSSSAVNLIRTDITNLIFAFVSAFLTCIFV